MLFGKKKKEDNQTEEHKEENSDGKTPEKSEKDIQADIKEKLSRGWIQVNFIFEVIGKPAEYVEESLKNLLDVLEKEKNAVVIKREQHPSEVYEETLFSTFAEVTIMIENLRRFMNIVFDYMPSSIEIMEPQEIKVKYLDLNVVMNELANNLHRNDIEMKKLQFERNFLSRKLEELGAKLREAKEKKEENSNN
jgi:hypothetical protein